MKVEIKKLNSLKRILKIEIAEESLKNDKLQVYKDISKNLKVPGFRPGTAPFEIIETRYEKALKEEFLKRFVPIYYENAIQSNNLKPASLPHFFDIEYTSNKLAFSAELEVEPELDIDEEKYKGFKIKDKKIEVTDNEWEKLLQSLKDNFKKIAKKDTDDSTLAKWAGYPDMETLKEMSLLQLKNIRIQQRRQFIEQEVINELLKRIKIDVPSKVVENYLSQLVNREISQLRFQENKDENIEKYKKDLEDKLKPVAIDHVRLHYITSAIIKKENLESNPDHYIDTVIGYILSYAEFSY